MTTLAQLHDCHSCNDERSIVQKKKSVRCEMNGLFYTSIFYRNECGGLHVRRAVVCGWLFTLGTLLFR